MRRPERTFTKGVYWTYQRRRVLAYLAAHADRGFNAHQLRLLLDASASIYATLHRLADAGLLTREYRGQRDIRWFQINDAGLAEAQRQASRTFDLDDSEEL